MFLERWRRNRDLHSAARRIAEARLRGDGVYVQDWHLHGLPDGGHHLVESIIEWCRHILGQSRKPWGIDAFDLAIAFRYEDEQVRSQRFLRLRPVDLYQETIAHNLASFLLSSWRSPGQAPRSLRVAAALFCWGDAAHQALPPAS